MKLASFLASFRNYLTGTCNGVDEFIRSLAPLEVGEEPSAEAGFSTVTHPRIRGRMFGRLGLDL